MKKLFTLITVIILLFPQVILADFEPADDEENAANTLILDADDTGGDITLQFGKTLAEFIKWNSSTLSFDFSDETLVLDASNTGAGANVNIVANQGSDNDGTLRYNATTNQWEYSNDGGTFNAIGGAAAAADQSSVKARRTTTYAITSSFVDITLDTTDVENDVTIVEHDNTNTDQITLHEAGLYAIRYHTNINSPGTSTNLNIEGQIRVNNTTVINGSDSRASIFDDTSIPGSDHTDYISRTFLYNATADDFITLQLRHVVLGGTGTTTTLAGLTVEVIRLSGQKGVDGINGTDGADGADGTDGADGAPGPPGSGSTINIQEEGSAIPNTPHSVLNFIGSTVTATDAGGGVTNITISSSGADFEGVYATDTGNNLDTSNGIFTIATGSNDFVVDSNDWNVTAAGALDASGMSSTGTIDFSGASSFRIHEGAADPGTCTEGQMFYNTTDNYLKLCTATNTWTPQGRRVPDMNHFVDTTIDSIVSTNNTTNYWDGTIPNITPISANSEILVMMTVSFDPNGTADESDVVRIERNVGSAPTCGSSTQVGDQIGWLTSDNDVDGASAIYVDTPGTTSTTYYTLCSDSESTDTGGSIIEIQFTLYEMNDAADLAEIYATRDSSLKAGELVSLDPNLIAGVKRSEKAYDSKVFGVVSTKPAQLIGNTNGEGITGLPVALSGRVPVKVNTENGSIKPGDLLTTSSTPGVAMKATKPGYIIGRAFNSYSGNSTGVILLFVGTHYANPDAMN